MISSKYNTCTTVVGFKTTVVILICAKWFSQAYYAPNNIVASKKNQGSLSTLRMGLNFVMPTTHGIVTILSNTHLYDLI